jgi:hypothetical protein
MFPKLNTHLTEGNTMRARPVSPDRSASPPPSSWSSSSSYSSSSSSFLSSSSSLSAPLSAASSPADSIQNIPKQPASSPHSENLSSFSSDTTSIWDRLQSIRNWVVDKWHAIISCFCCRVEALPANTPLPENTDELIAPLKNWLVDDTCSQPVINFERMRIEETLIDFDALKHPDHDHHQAVVDRLKQCTEPTYFPVKYSERISTSLLIIIPFEVTNDPDSAYQPDYVLLTTDLLGEWECTDSKGERIAIITHPEKRSARDKGFFEYNFWLRPLLQTGTYQNDQTIYRLRKDAQEEITL